MDVYIRVTITIKFSCYLRTKSYPHAHMVNLEIICSLISGYQVIVKLRCWKVGVEILAAVSRPSLKSGS